MLHANISTAEKYDYLSAKFKAAYKWLANTDIEALADGAYRVLGDDVIANVQSYTTSPADSLRYETHDEHFDIQYIAEGREFFAVCPREGLTLLESKPERDAKFWSAPDDICSMMQNSGPILMMSAVWYYFMRENLSSLLLRKHINHAAVWVRLPMSAKC